MTEHKQIEKNFKSYFTIYLLLLFFFSLIFLIEKHNGGSDSTISEWLINYSGGFTKRGIIGQLSIIVANFFDLNLRDSILILQILSVGTYFILIFNFIKNIKVNKLIILSIFTPIFLLYPIAEIEVLARKEILIFCIFLTYLLLENSIYKNIYKVFFLTLSVLIWEPVIFYFIYFLALDIVHNKFEKIDKRFLINLLYYIPAIIIAAYIALNPLSGDNHEVMAAYLKENFNEDCYMSCALLKSKSSIYSQFQGNFGNYSLEIFLRYFLIIFFGFGPLILILRNSSLIDSNLIFFKYFKNLFFPISIILFPVILLFAMGYDWGRWVNISYFFTIIFYLNIYKKKKTIFNEVLLKNKYLKYLENKKIFLIVIIIFCFGWNPKTTMTGDVASKPGYQIPKKAIEIIYFRLSKK